jgi:hypothetical protein
MSPAIAKLNENIIFLDIILSLELKALIKICFLDSDYVFPRTELCSLL